MFFLDNEDLPYGGVEDSVSSTRELALVILEQLSISFDKLACLEEANPLIERLVEIAYSSGRSSRLQ
jgi:hypothetical protein